MKKSLVKDPSADCMLESTFFPFPTLPPHLRTGGLVLLKQAAERCREKPAAGTGMAQTAWWGVLGRFQNLAFLARRSPWSLCHSSVTLWIYGPVAWMPARQPQDLKLPSQVILVIDSFNKKRYPQLACSCPRGRGVVAPEARSRPNPSTPTSNLKQETSVLTWKASGL